MNHTCCNNQTPDGYFQRHENGYCDLCARRKNARLKIEKLPAKWHDDRKEYGKISRIEENSPNRMSKLTENASRKSKLLGKSQTQIP
jgi:hypothetical protein